MKKKKIKKTYIKIKKLFNKGYYKNSRIHSTKNLPISQAYG